MRFMIIVKATKDSEAGVMPGDGVSQQETQLLVTFNGYFSSPSRMIHPDGFARDAPLEFIGVFPEIVQEPCNARHVRGTEKTGIACSQLANID